MRSFSPRAFLTGASAILLAGLMVACSSDPNRERQRYLKRGNEYFAQGKYPEAAVTLRNICRKDFAWGPACYRLGETYIALDQATAAAEALRNAAALLPETSPEHWEALAKLSDLYLAAAAGDKNAMEEVATYSQQLLQHDPRSFDGHRITGDLNYARAVTAYRSRRRDDWLKMLNAAIEEYRQADSIEPHQSGVGMQMARAFRAKGDSRAAASQYQAVIASAPAFVPAYREYYGLLMEEQKTLDAERLLKTAIEKNPRRIEFRIQLAEHDLAMGRRDEMRNVLARIQAEARNFDRAHLATGDLYRKLGNSDAAMVEYRAGEAQDPKNRIDYQKRERDVLLEQGRIGDANGVNRQILKNYPRDENARTMSAVFVLNGGDTAKGISQLDALVAESPDNTDARFHLGQAYFRSGDTSQAQRQFTEILIRHPNDIRARLALAELEIHTRNFDRALQDAGRVIAMDRASLDAGLITVAAYQGQKRFADAQALLARVLAMHPTSIEALLLAGQLDMGQKKFSEAEKAFRKAWNLKPADLRGLSGIADSLLARGAPDAAIAAFQNECNQAPGNANLRLGLARLLMRTAHYDEAIREFQQVAGQLNQHAPQRSGVYLSIGESYRRKGDFARAVSSLEEARKNFPDNVDILSELALSLQKSGRAPEAKQAYEAALQINPNNAAVLNNLAFLITETNGNLDEALSDVQKARQLQPDMDSALDTMGWIYLRKGIVDTAVQIFEVLVRRQDDHCAYHYHLGAALLRKNDRAGAVRELRKALALNPAGDEKARIQELLRSAI